MPDVYKGKPYMTEEYYEYREIPNTKADITIGKWLDNSKLILKRDKEMLKEILDELESENASRKPNTE